MNTKQKTPKANRQRRPKNTSLLLLALMLALPWTVRSQDIIPQEGLARQFLSHLLNKEVDEMSQMFSAAFLEQVPEGQIREIAEGMEAQLGPFSHVSRVLHESDQGYHTVILVCRFGEMDWALRITFDSEQKISGFFLTMAPPGSSTPPPDWVDPATIEEIPMELDCGDIALPAILTRPTDGEDFPIVVLVHGSGAHDADQSIGPNKIFRDIAWGLASEGIAVLRYEKRNFRHQRTLITESITVWEEAGSDAVHAIHAAMAFPGVDTGRVFLLGHSLGGMIAPRIAQEVPQLAGIISMAGTPRQLYEIIPAQLEHLMMLNESETDEALQQLEEVREVVNRLRAKKNQAGAVYESTLLGMPPSYLEDLNRHDIGQIAAALPQAILILHGGRDYQVRMEDYVAWQEALRDHHNTTFALHPEMDHLFFAGEGPSTPASYFQENNVDQAVIKDISNWIHSL